MSTSTAGASGTGSTSSPIFSPQPTSATRTSIDLFPTGPTGTQSAATATSSTASGGGRGPSLYLIVVSVSWPRKADTTLIDGPRPCKFLSILVLLLVTSISIAIRAVHFRRRYRRALARGEVPSVWADNRTTDFYPDTWWRPTAMNRFFGIDPDGDHLDAMLRGDWAPHGAGRRRKAKRDYGEVPVLYEADLVSEDDETLDRAVSVAWSEKQASPLANPFHRYADACSIAFSCGGIECGPGIRLYSRSPRRAIQCQSRDRNPFTYPITRAQLSNGSPRERFYTCHSSHS